MYRQNKDESDELQTRGLMFLDLSNDNSSKSTVKDRIFSGTVILACFDGNAELTVNGKIFSLSKGELMAVLPMQEMKMQNTGSECNIKAILLSEEFLNGIPFRPDLDLLKETYIHPHIVPDEKSMNDISILFDMALRRDANDACSDNIQKALAISILTIAATQVKKSTTACKKESTRQGTITKAFIDMLLKNFHNERSTAYYAERLCVTSKYLCTAVKSATGHTIQEWANEITANEAKRLLCITDNSVKMISEALNFSTPASFIRFFRKNAGLTPMEYRRRNIRD